jgi:hypothetical protein
MPVRWSFSGTGPGAIELSGDGAVTTEMNWSGSSSGIVPLLIYDAGAREIHWRLPSGQTGVLSTLHALGDNQLLVASTSDDAKLVEQLFPNREIVNVQLSDADLDTSPMAFSTLDALVLRPAALARTCSENRRILLNQGVELIVPAAEKPDDGLPWHRAGAAWVATPLPVFLPVINPDVYAPAAMGLSGQSETFRRNAVAMAAIDCLLIGLIALWRSRWMPLAAIGLSIAILAVTAAVVRGRSPISQRSGIVEVEGPDVFEDQWTFVAARRATNFELPVIDWLRPIFAGEEQAAALRLKLICGQQGQPVSLRGNLGRDDQLAVMTRRAASPIQFNPGVITSPLRLLLQESIYPGYAAIGQAGGNRDEELWPTIVVRPQ